MDFLKRLFNEIKNSTFISNTTDMLKPTENWILNKGGLNVLLMSVPFLILNVVIDSLSSITSWGLGGLILKVITLGLSFIAFIVVMGTQAACLDSFDSLVNRGEKPNFGRFFKVIMTDSFKFTINYMKYVGVYLLAIWAFGRALRYVPFVNGTSIANLIKIFLKYGLTFRMYAILLGMNGDDETISNIKHWFTFAIIAYIVNVAISFVFISNFISYVFVLFTVLILSNKNSSQNNDSFNDGFEDAVSGTLTNQNNDSFNDGFEDRFNF